jgi:hypothetical protein
MRRFSAFWDRRSGTRLVGCSFARYRRMEREARSVELLSSREKLMRDSELRNLLSAAT